MTAGYLELQCGRVQGVLHQVGVVRASLQHHENVLKLQVDLGVQRALDIQHWRAAGGDQRKGSDAQLQAVFLMQSERSVLLRRSLQNKASFV